MIMFFVYFFDFPRNISLRFILAKVRCTYAVLTLYSSYHQQRSNKIFSVPIWFLSNLNMHVNFCLRLVFFRPIFSCIFTVNLLSPAAIPCFCCVRACDDLLAHLLKLTTRISKMFIFNSHLSIGKCEVAKT